VKPVGQLQFLWMVHVPLFLHSGSQTAKNNKITLNFRKKRKSDHFQLENISNNSLLTALILLKHRAK
jgi:hypothetical protein